MSKTKESKKEEVVTFKAYSLVRKNGGYTIVELTIEGDKVINVTDSPEDVLAITEGKLTRKMRPV